MLGRTDSRRRLLFLLVTFAVVGASLLTRLAYWQIAQRDRLAQEAFAQTTMRQEAPSRRGDIYDRSGVVVLRHDRRPGAPRRDAVRAHRHPTARGCRQSWSGS